MKKVTLSTLAMALAFAAVPAFGAINFPTPQITCTSGSGMRDNNYTVTVFWDDINDLQYAEVYHSTIAGAQTVLKTPVTYSTYRCMPNTRCMNSSAFYTGKDLTLTIFPGTLPGSTDRRGELVAEVNGARIVEQVRCFRPMHIM